MRRIRKTSNFGSVREPAGLQSGYDARSPAIKLNHRMCGIASGRHLFQQSSSPRKKVSRGPPPFVLTGS
jgi:hypothetical protein